MAVRDFTDGSGARWRAWDVTPTRIVPATKGEDYLAAIYQTGWIVFESASGGEKRRLSMVPAGWGDASDEELRSLLARAEMVSAQRVQYDRQMRHAADREVPRMPGGGGAPDLSDLQVIRTFRYPGGRYWTVCVMKHPEEGGPPMLRFTSGARNIDLETWPRDWADYPEERLVELLRSGAPRLDAGPPPPGAPARRWTDRPTPSA